MTNAGQWFYSVFGLTIQSAIELPELAGQAATERPDLVIAKDESLWLPGDCDRWLDHHPSGDVLTIEDVAQFEVDSTGHRMLVRALADVPPRNLRLYLLGSAMGLVLHRRGLLPLHCNAVSVEGRAFAFLGPSGAGKSTLAAWLLDHGFDLLADDVCVVRGRAGGKPLLFPGLPRIRLYEAPLRRSGRDPANYAPSFLSTNEPDKFDVPSGMTIPDPVNLAAIFLLDRGDRAAFEPIEGAAAVEALMANTYRGGFLLEPAQRRRHWEQCVALAGTTPLLRFRRRWDEEYFPDDAQWLAGRLADLALA